MNRIRWSGPAQRELVEIDDDHTAINPATAARILGEIIRAAEFLLAHPRAGALIERLDFRKWRVGGTTYLLIYRIDGQDVRIDRVLHDRQDRRNLP